MSAAPHPLIGALPADTIENTLDAVSLVIAHLSAPPETRPDRADMGARALLGAVADALQDLARRIGSDPRD